MVSLSSFKKKKNVVVRDVFDVLRRLDVYNHNRAGAMVQYVLYVVPYSMVISFAGYADPKQLSW